MIKVCYNHLYLFIWWIWDFDDLCHEIITELKKKYPHIKWVYICEDYKFISRPHKRPKWLKDKDYEAFEYYEMKYTGFYKRIYFRNCEIIDHSDYCVFCVDENSEHLEAIKALKHAKRKKKEIVNILQIVWGIWYLCYTKKYAVKWNKIYKNTTNCWADFWNKLLILW